MRKLCNSINYEIFLSCQLAYLIRLFNSYNQFIIFSFSLLNLYEFNVYAFLYQGISAYILILYKNVYTKLSILTLLYLSICVLNLYISLVSSFNPKITKVWKITSVTYEQNDCYSRRWSKIIGNQLWILLTKYELNTV